MLRQICYFATVLEREKKKSMQERRTGRNLLIVCQHGLMFGNSHGVGVRDKGWQCRKWWMLDSWPWG